MSLENKLEILVITAYNKLGQKPNQFLQIAFNFRLGKGQLLDTK